MKKKKTDKHHFSKINERSGSQLVGVHIESVGAYKNESITQKMDGQKTSKTKTADGE
jgi:hypothetical protein